MHFFLRDPDLGTMSFELISILAVSSLVSQSPNSRFMQSRAVDPWFGGVACGGMTNIGNGSQSGVEMSRISDTYRLRS